MVKITIVGRVSDGLPLAQGPRYVGEEDDSNFQSYRLQAEFILKEIARSGSPPPSKMTIRLHHHFFNYMVENGVCFITLCDSSYPRKLAFHYLQDLAKELDKFDRSLIDKITKPYSFVRFDGIIGNVRRQYTDTRTQSNLSKLNANRRQELDIITEDMSTIVERRRRLGNLSLNSLSCFCGCLVDMHIILELKKNMRIFVYQMCWKKQFLLLKLFPQSGAPHYLRK